MRVRLGLPLTFSGAVPHHASDLDEMRAGLLLAADTCLRQEHGLKWAKLAPQEPERGRRPAMQQHIATPLGAEQDEVPAFTVGLDVGDRHTHICVLDAGAEVVREQRIRTTALALRRALGSFRVREWCSRRERARPG